ncbi:MAG: hypothetical protein ACP5I4_04030 [Oceanipulchritudo sp.]
MILVTTALMMEARPLCAALGLGALGNQPFPAFIGGDHLLVVSGTGPQRAAAATAWAMGRHRGIRAALNIGFAGASSSHSPLHVWHLVHSIRDASTGRLHIPDILFKHPFRESALLTVGKVVRRDTGWEGLVDMEGSGFYEAARRFLAPDRISLLKWVSDPLSGSVEAEGTAALFSSAAAEAVTFLENWPAAAPPPETGDPPLLAAVRQRLRLTETQSLFLAKWIRGYVSRGGAEDKVLDLLPDQPPRAKAGNKRIFQALENVLKS